VPGCWTFTAKVSSGTYIRGLTRDLGAALGCGGILTALRRTSIGPLDLADAVPPPGGNGSADQDRLASATLPLERIPIQASTLRIEEEREAERFRHGSSLDSPGPPLPEGSTVRVLGPSGSLLGVGRVGDGRVRPQVVLA
jgi:tRNA pseudouridine55 synthase